MIGNIEPESVPHKTTPTKVVPTSIPPTASAAPKYLQTGSRPLYATLRSGPGWIQALDRRTLRVSVAQLIPFDQRRWAYGLYNGVFGFAWFAGSAAAGWLYEINIGGMVIFLFAAQLLAIPFLWRAFSFAD